MSKFYFCLAITFSLLFCGIIALSPQNSNNFDKADFLRIHIRANSNENIDQNVKYMVKNKIVDEMNAFLAESKTKQQAMQNISNNLDNIIATANNVLREQGFSYRANAQLAQENFPTRKYDNVVLSAGVYDALIINLGSGKGDNWWCVVYPPLCFVSPLDNGTQNIVYRSKLLEIIKTFFK